MPVNRFVEQQILNAAKSENIRRKCFISYYAGDTDEVDTFLKSFDDVFIKKAIGVSDGDDFINSDDSDYVMGKIREKYLGDSTVTLLMLGSCTHSRRYIDWELKTSLRQGSYTPNGLLGICLASVGNSCHLPERFKDNYNSDASDQSYALYRSYPSSKAVLRSWINTAFTYRTSRANLIQNSQSMFKYNRTCKVHDKNH